MIKSGISTLRSRQHNSWFRSIFLLPIILLTCMAFSAQAQRHSYPHDGGLWGALKSNIVPIAQPVQDTLNKEYNKLSDTGRFVAGACLGFGATKCLVGATINTVKTVGIVYIVFEALEYAGILNEARVARNKQQYFARARNYCLRTMDGIRCDMRSQCNPTLMHRRVKRRMEKDTPGTVGFGTGAFLGFAI